MAHNREAGYTINRLVYDVKVGVLPQLMLVCSDLSGVHTTTLFMVMWYQELWLAWERLQAIALGACYHGDQLTAVTSASRALYWSLKGTR